MEKLVQGALGFFFPFGLGAFWKFNTSKQKNLLVFLQKGQQASTLSIGLAGAGYMYIFFFPRIISLSCCFLTRLQPPPNRWTFPPGA